jgi:membrane fusion protein, multidrug efflux system
MKKIITLAVLFIIIIFLILLKIFILDKKEAGPAKPIADLPTPADGFIVRDTSVEYKISTVGSIQPNEFTEIVSEINKKVTRIMMKEGSFVNKGDLLFKLDDEDLQAKLKKLKIEEELAATTESREKARLEKGGASQQHYDEVLYTLKKIKAEIEILNVDISKTEISAPFAGKIGLRNISLGSYVNPNTILATLSDVKTVKIDFSIPERYSNDVKLNQPVEFTTDYSPVKYIGKIYAVEPVIDRKTRSLLIRAICDNSKLTLVPGSSVKADLTVNEIIKSIFIPTEALIPTQKGYVVYLMKDGKAAMIPVKSGIRTKTSVQILEGLSLGDTIITTNLLKIKPKAAVNIVSYK